jgi:protein-disulfide isomerase
MSTTRTPPRPPSRRLPPTAQPPRRRGLGVLLIPLALIALAGAALVGVHYATDGGGTTKVDSSSLKFVDLAKSEFAGVPSNGNTIGSPSAPVTIEEYGDLRCPVCRDFDANVIPDVVTRLVKTGKAKLVYHHWPILGDNSVYAGRAAYAAQQQGKLWEYAQVVYFNQGDERDAWFDQTFARAVASAIGLDMAQFDRDFGKTGQVDAQIQATNSAASKLQLQGTPSLRISGAGGAPIVITGSVADYDQIAQAVQKVTPR